MNKKIMLTRHGETEWNTVRRMQGQLDSPLTEIGVRQAKWLAKRLEDEAIDVIYSSPLGRAFNTAKIIGKKHQADIIQKDELKEMGFGCWQGQLLEDIEQKYPETNYNFWNKPEKFEAIDGESLEQLIKRSGAFYEECIVNSEHKNILVVAHAVILKSLIAYTKKSEIKDFWQGKHLQPTSLTVAELDGNILTYTVVGDISHHEEKSDFNGWFIDSE